jgi:plasmid stabilization system protein ParE
MIYQVRLQPAAVEDLDVAYQYAAQNAPAAAAGWLERFQAGIQTLEHNPERCQLAPENIRSSRDLRNTCSENAPMCCV